jgi:hypothetical protein
MNNKEAITAISAIPVTGRGGLENSEVLRISHCLDSRFRDGGKVFSLTHRPLSTPKKYFLVLILVRLPTEATEF